MVLFRLPNLLTLARIGVVLPIIGLFLVGDPWADWTILGLFIAAGITDFLDGHVARATGSVTPLGRLLDPIADKLLVAAVLLMLAGTGRLDPVGLIAAVIIVLREIAVSGLREFLAGRAQLRVTALAKWKTAVQFVALALLIVPPAPVWDGAGAAVGTVALVAAATLTIITGWHYVRAGLPFLISDESVDAP